MPCCREEQGGWGTRGGGGGEQNKSRDRFKLVVLFRAMTKSQYHICTADSVLDIAPKSFHPSKYRYFVSNVFRHPSPGISVFLRQKLNERFHVSNIDVVSAVFLFTSIASNSIRCPNTNGSQGCRLRGQGVMQSAQLESLATYAPERVWHGAGLVSLLRRSFPCSRLVSKPPHR